MAYNGKYKGSEIDALLNKAGTALQSVPSEYITEEELNNKGYATTSAMNTALGNKVDKVSGKQLSTEDFTTALKNKLNGLSNYDDTAVNNAISGLQTQINTLVSGDANTAIESFNEIIAFLDGVSDTETLEGIIASIEQQIANKQDVISDLAAIRAGAAKGATALQSHQDISYLATKTELSNGLAAKVDAVSGKGLSTNDYTTTEKNKLSGIAAGAEVNVQSDWNTTDINADSYIKNKPTIPSAVTESTVSGWGFTKNTGTYSKPSSGIPKSDLASDVQNSLEKAANALQYPAYPVVNQGTSNTSIALNPNTFYIWGNVRALTLTFGEEIEGITNEYLFQFTAAPKTSATVTLPASIKWINGEAPVFLDGETYQISILNNLAICATFID